MRSERKKRGGKKEKIGRKRNRERKIGREKERQVKDEVGWRN